MPTLAINKQALHDYEVLETYEAGIVLLGHEVKSVRQGHINLKGAYATFKQGQLWLTNAHISPYVYAGPMPAYDPTAPRRLLITKKEIKKLLGKLQQKGLTLIPIKVYTKNTLIKLEFGLAKGKKKADKREIIKKRDTDREIRRAMRNKQ